MGPRGDANCCLGPFPTAETSDLLFPTVQTYTVRQPIFVTQIITLLNAFAAALKL